MWKKEYKKWINYDDLDTNLREDLLEKNEDELEEMFYQSLSFGTGGMRGILGPGINRLNIYTLRRANAGLSKYLLKNFKEKDLKRGVVIAHDNRHLSKEFAKESAKVLGAKGIKSYLFTDLRPTPELSFAVRELNAIAGIIITASHNPPNYNGYKIYDQYGCQFTPKYANKIVEYVNEVKDLFAIKTMSIDELENSNLIEYINTKIDDLYIEKLKSIQINKKINKPLKIVFSPLHGTSAKIGLRILEETGYKIYPVKEQMVPDPNFSTVKSPNPEDESAFDFAVNLGKEIEADLLLATDPDGDRLGIAVKKKDEFKFLNGNQTGAILLYYLLSEKQKLNSLPKKGVVFNTIVTSNLGSEIARKYGMEVISTLTGFKFIGEQARYLENDERDFVFGYEESYGYVIKDFVRDKDSFQAMLLIAEAANYYSENEDKNLYDKLVDIYKEFGYYLEGLESVRLEGKSGQARIKKIMEFIRNNPFKKFNENKVLVYEDFYLSQKVESGIVNDIDLPKSNVIKYTLSDSSWFVFRPSGTEPKLKIYAGVVGENIKDSKEKLTKMLIKLVDFIKKVE